VKLYETLEPAVLGEVIDLIAETTKHDGIPPVAEHVLLHLRHGGDKEDRHIVLESDGVIAGYAHLDLTDQVEGPSAELVIHPSHRSKGLGENLLAEIVRIAKDSNGNKKLRLWSHGDLPGARRLAERGGFIRVRTVVQMRRPLTGNLPEKDARFGYRNFVVGEDEGKWLELNNRAFSGHPDQGSWTLRDIQVRELEEWFEPAGFIIASDEMNQRPAMKGFCWVKIHGGVSHHHDGSSHDHDPIGEIYVMGVDPAVEQSQSRAFTTCETKGSTQRCSMWMPKTKPVLHSTEVLASPNGDEMSSTDEIS
jgi:mycothiol synthase